MKLHLSIPFLAAAISEAIKVPLELREATGLSEHQLRDILTGRASAPVYGQCGGIGWTGATTCAAGSTCTVSNAYYSQCLPGSSSSSSTSKPTTSTSQSTTTKPTTSTSTSTKPQPTSQCTAPNITITWPAATNPSAYDNAKRNAFVTRSGSNLMLDGQPFRLAGANVYWLGLDENVIPDPAYPSKQRVLEIFGVISAMRMTAIRAHTLGVSVGNPLSVEPSLDVFNENAYESIDFAIAVARVYGIKLLIPLTDNWNWYHGGKYQFIGWAGIPFSGTGGSVTPGDVGAYFYNTTSIVNSFERYITHHLNHVNQYTGIAYKNDPTILGWETGNELSGAFNSGPAPPAWTAQIAAFIKNLAPKHLVLDGTSGIYPTSGQLQNTNVDIFSDHFYPANINKLNTGMNAVKAVNRNYLAGEYDWEGTHGGDDVATFLSTIQKSGFAGDFFWSLFGHDDQCCQYVDHNDGYTFQYQRTAFNTQQGTMLTNHFNAMTGAQAPEILPEVSCPAAKFPTALYPSSAGVSASSLGITLG